MPGKYGLMAGINKVQATYTHIDDSHNIVLPGLRTCLIYGRESSLLIPGKYDLMVGIHKVNWFLIEQSLSTVDDTDNTTDNCWCDYYPCTPTLSFILVSHLHGE